MAFMKVGDPDTSRYIKPNADGSINIGSSLGSFSIDVGDVQIGAVEIKDDDTGSRLDIVSAGAPTNYLGAQLIAGTQVVGSIQAVQSGTWTIGGLTGGSVLLEAGDAIIGSTVIIDGGASITVDVGTALPAGTLNIGSVNIEEPIPAGAAIIGSTVVVDGGASLTVDVGTALPAGTQNIGSVNIEEPLPAGNLIIGSIVAVDGGASLTVDVGTALPAGTSIIGSTVVVDGGASLTVDVGTELPSGTQNVGSVDIEAALPAGTSVIGSVQSVQSGTWNVGTVTTVSSLTAGSVQLQPGTDVVGSAVIVDGGASITVDVGTALPAGTNALGSVYPEQIPTGSVYVYENAGSLVGVWLEGVTGGIVETSLAYSGNAGSVIAIVRTAA